MQGFAQGVQFGEVVVAGLNVFAHPFRRAVGRGRAAAGLGLGAVAHAAVGEGAVETQHGVSGGGLILGQMHDLVAGHGQAVEQGVGEDLGQFGLRRRAAGLAEVPQVDVIGFGQTQQKLSRDGALVALDMVQIRGRDAQVRRHRRLRQVKVAPQPLEAAAQKQLAIGGGVHGAIMSHHDFKASVMM